MVCRVSEIASQVKSSQVKSSQVIKCAHDAERHTPESLAETEPRRQAHNGMADDAEDSESVLGRIQDQACVCHTRCT